MMDNSNFNEKTVILKERDRYVTSQLYGFEVSIWFYSKLIVCYFHIFLLILVQNEK